LYSELKLIHYGEAAKFSPAAIKVGLGDNELTGDLCQAIERQEVPLFAPVSPFDIAPRDSRADNDDVRAARF
jgi:hypothetical protein